MACRSNPTRGLYLCNPETLLNRLPLCAARPARTCPSTLISASAPRTYLPGQWLLFRGHTGDHQHIEASAAGIFGAPRSLGTICPAAQVEWPRSPGRGKSIPGPGCHQGREGVSLPHHTHHLPPPPGARPQPQDQPLFLLRKSTANGNWVHNCPPPKTNLQANGERGGRISLPYYIRAHTTASVLPLGLQSPK